MKSVVIIGGGYAGFYTAWGLEKRLRPHEARVTVVDPLPYMTYQPFLPEVAAGSIEARHAVVPLRRHLRRTHIVSGRATRINHEDHSVQVELADGSLVTFGYDEIVVTAGAVTRVFPVPGLAETAIGLKRIEEAVAVRDTLITSLHQAASLPSGLQRRRRLTVTFVGGGFAGVEGLGEVMSLAKALLRDHPEINASELSFHLIDASNRLLPEVTQRGSDWVQRHLERRGATVHLRTTIESAVDGRVRLSTGEEFDSGLIVWTAGIAANPVVARQTDLPANERGLLVVRPDLRVGTTTQPVAHAWAAGDVAAVPDVVVGADEFTVPNAQHAVRQGKLLARNVTAALRGKEPTEYRHHNLGIVATLGLGQGIFQSGPITITGFAAWVMHRGYHVLAVPTWERKIRVSLGWMGAFLLGRDSATLESVQHAREAFHVDAHRHDQELR